MIVEKVECKRLGNEYKNLFEKVIYFIHHTPFAKEYINDNDLKMLSDLDLYLHIGKYEIIEFGTRKCPFDVTNALKEKDKEIERLKELCNKYEDNTFKLWTKKMKEMTCYKEFLIYKSRNEKAIEYIHNNQPVFELSSKEQIQEWFEKEYYVELLNILQGSDK